MSKECIVDLDYTNARILYSNNKKVCSISFNRLLPGEVYLETTENNTTRYIDLNILEKFITIPDRHNSTRKKILGIVKNLDDIYYQFSVLDSSNYENINKSCCLCGKDYDGKILLRSLYSEPHAMRELDNMIYHIDCINDLRESLNKTDVFKNNSINLNNDKIPYSKIYKSSAIRKNLHGKECIMCSSKIKKDEIAFIIDKNTAVCINDIRKFAKVIEELLEDFFKNDYQIIEDYNFRIEHSSDIINCSICSQKHPDFCLNYSSFHRNCFNELINKIDAKILRKAKKYKISEDIC